MSHTIVVKWKCVLFSILSSTWTDNPFKHQAFFLVNSNGTNFLLYPYVQAKVSTFLFFVPFLADASCVSSNLTLQVNKMWASLVKVQVGVGMENQTLIPSIFFFWWVEIHKFEQLNPSKKYYLSIIFGLETGKWIYIQIV